MKVAVFGFYNNRNAGDDRIQHCITRMLRPQCEIIFLPHNVPPPIDLLRTCSWVLIGGGGLVFDEVGIWLKMRKWIQQSRVAVGVVGLGVNRVSPRLKDELGDLLDLAKFVYVRDAESKKLLHDDARVSVFSDISWAYPLRHKTAHSVEGVALNLTPCPWKVFEPEKWIEALGDEVVHPFPLYFRPDRDSDLLSKFFPGQVHEEFSLDPLLHSRVLVAARYHALIFAMQLNIPFVAVKYDGKIDRLLHEAGFNDYGLETEQPDRLRAKLGLVERTRSEFVKSIQRYSVERAARAKEMTGLVREHLGLVPSGAVDDQSRRRLRLKFAGLWPMTWRKTR